MVINLYKKTMSFRNKVLWIILFLFWSCIMYYAPFSSDDYYWGGFNYEDVGELLETAFVFGNGRLLGNIFVNVLVRSTVLRVLVKAGLITSLAWMIPKILKCEGGSTPLLVSLLFLAMDPELFGQVLVWTAGFCNFIPPIWGACVVILLIRRGEQRDNWLLGSVLIFILGFSSQLFLESNTLINVLMSVGYLGLGLLEKRKGAPQKLIHRSVWLAASLAGASLMFLIPVMAGRTGAMDGYREVHVFNLLDLVKTAAQNLIKIVYYFENSTVLCLVIMGLTLMILHWDCTILMEKKRIIGFCSIISALYILWEGLLRESVWLGHLAAVKLAVGSIPAIVLFLCFLITLVASSSKHFFVPMILFAASVAPFLVITPVTKRCIMLAYVFMIFVIVPIWNEMEQRLQKATQKTVKNGMKMLVCSLAICLCFTFHNIHTLDTVRTEHIRRGMSEGLETIEIFRIPYHYVYWDEEWCFERFYRYETLYDIDFVVLELLQWIANNG